MQPKKILIVDDEVALAKALQLKLQKEGFVTELASNGEEALKILAENTYDLLLLDLLMPQVDGWEVLAKITDKNMVVVVTSNLGQPEDIERAKQLGASDFLVKSNTSLSDISLHVQTYLKDYENTPTH